MNDRDRPASLFSNRDAAKDPEFTKSTIEPLGLTLLATGGPNPAMEVIFVHGLQGHPENTWTYTTETKSKGNKGEANTSKLKFWKKAKKGTSSVSRAATLPPKDCKIYWPTQLLAHDLPNARVFTYGYDSQISHFFNGPANQNTITENGRALLNSIASQRQDCQGRPLMLVVHSLGGIVIKSALRISAQADDIDADLRDIYESAFAILFFGTPHRGSDWTNAGQIARKFVSALGLSTNSYNLQALQGNTEILEILRDDFVRMLGKEAFQITSFQESYGFKGVKGFDAKIVGPDSSGLDHPSERKIPINGNHMDMCKFSDQGCKRREYDQIVRSEFRRHWQRESERIKELQNQFTPLDSTPSSLLDLIYATANKWHDNGTNNLDCNELLQSLELKEATSRFNQVDKACSQTFEWLFTKPELGFRSWLESGGGLYWCRGYPASGKSTLMKWVLNEPRTVAALASRHGRKTRASFFFHDRGSEIQKSFTGLRQSIMHQILRESRELLRLILPIHQEICKRRQPSWTEEDIERAFQCILGQQILRLDITLFLDALDEYNGKPEEIASFLHRIATAADTSQTRFRIFFSSRPLQIFLDKFRDVPGFDIHAHTVEDINLVIHSKMSQNPRMHQYMQAESHEDRLLAIEFKDKIASKAEGIVLWVILVLDELLEEFTEGESVRGLVKKLDRLPPKLEDFYQHTLNRLPRKYSNDTVLIFEVLKCAIRPLQLHDLFEICRCANIPRLAECTPCTAADNLYDNDSLQRWIRSRTAGLVQLVPSQDNSDPSEVEAVRDNKICPIPCRSGETIYLVEFLHQTVKPFATELTSRYSPHDPGYVYIARYILALSFHHSQKDSDIKRRCRLRRGDEDTAKEQKFWGRHGAAHLIDALALYVPLAESKTPKVLLASFIEFGDDRIGDLFDIPTWTSLLKFPPLTGVSAMAVVFGVYDLLDALLEQSKGKALHSSPPLLHLAVRHWSLFPHISSKNRIRIIRLLLDHGANTCEVFEKHTAYEYFCKIAMVWGPTSGDEFEGGTRAVVLSFLEAGQDPNVKINYTKNLAADLRFRSGEQCLLHYAAGIADIDLITVLLKHGADVNAVDEAGSTPLDWLCDVERTSDQVQLSELVDDFLRRSDDTGKHERLFCRLEAASILLSKGARYGVSTSAANDKFLVERKPITQTHVNGLRSRGIDVDDRLIRCPQNQIKTGFSGYITGPLNALRKITS